MDDDEEESFANLTPDQSREVLRKALNDRVQLRRLVKQTNENVLAQMADAGMGDFWFIALKRLYPRELFRLYELNRFIKHRHHFFVDNRSTSDDTLDALLNTIYSDILTPLDETLFCSLAFIDKFVKDDEQSVVKYFSRFVLGVGYEHLYRGIMDPTKEGDRALFDRMRRASLLYRYGTSKGNYRRFLEYGGNVNYTVRDVNDREILFYMVTGLYKAIRRRFEDTAMTVSEADGDQMMTEVRSQFNTIKEMYTNRPYDSRIDLKSIMKIVLPVYRAEVNAFVLSNIIDRDESAHYSALFRDDDSDNEIQLDRRVFDWLLPFDVGVYNSRRRNDGGTDYGTIQAEIKKILLQESYIWINMLIYEMHTERLMSDKGDKKRSSDDSSDDETNTKRPRYGQIVITAHTEESDLLSLLHGSGTLSLFFNRGKTETYRISAGDNIQIPRNMINYHMKYDDEEEDDDDSSSSSSSSFQ